MNIKDFIGIIGALFGVIIGGFMTLMTIRVQLRNQEKQRREERKIKTYEEIYKYLDTLGHEAGDIYVKSMFKIYKGKPIDTQGPKLPWEEINMRIDFYTPELKEDIKIIREKWGKLVGEFLLIVEGKFSKKKDPTELLKKTEEFSGQIGKQVEIAKHKLANLVNKIA